MHMKKFLFVVLATFVGCAMLMNAPKATAQIHIEIGTAPACPYGYYDVSPYSCAPYGYYGREWFPGGIFIGAGPWFHGRDNFHGHVNNRFHPDYGYNGPMPDRGQGPDPSHRMGRVDHFRGNEVRDGRGHSGRGGRR
jgi:hypothetical protein